MAQLDPNPPKESVSSVSFLFDDGIIQGSCRNLVVLGCEHSLAHICKGQPSHMRIQKPVIVHCLVSFTALEYYARRQTVNHSSCGFHSLSFTRRGLQNQRTLETLSEVESAFQGLSYGNQRESLCYQGC